MLRGFIVGFVFCLALLGPVGSGAYPQDRKDPERYQAEIADATPIQVGTLTRKQLTHSRLYNGYAKNLPGQSISELITTYRGKMTVIVKDVYGRMWFASDQPDMPEEYFARFAKESDLIVRGRPISKTSQITEDDAFLFTDYDLVVSEIFKNNIADPIEPGGAIRVTEAGGKIVVDGVIIKAGGNGVALLPVNSRDVLLFLKLVHGSDGYKLANNGAFELTGTSAIPLAGYFNFDRAFFKDESLLLKTIKEASSQ